MATMLAQPAASSSSLSPRNKMRLAKLALMEAENKEVEGRRERRRSRRESSFGMMPGVSPSPSMTSLSSVATPSPPASVRSLKPTPPSILRRRSSACFTLPTESPSSLPPTTPLRPTPLTSPHSTPSPTYLESPTRSIPRRNSRVRFSEGPLPPAYPTPLPVGEDMRRTSSIEDLRADLAISARSLSMPRRASFASFSTVASDPFALQAYASPLSRLSHIRDSEDLDAFDPQPLPYPKVPSQLARLSMDTTSAPSSGSSPASSSPRLREVINRPSFAVSPILAPSSRHSYAHSVLGSRASFASIASTLLLLDQTDPPMSAVLPRNSVYSAVLASQRTLVSEQRQPPTINRGEWNDVNAGLSPRSGPSPMVEQEAVIENCSVLEAKRIVESSDVRLSSSLPGLSSTPRPERVERVDTVDVLPSLDEFNEDGLLSIEHQRSESTLSLTLDFPIPPMRTPTLDVSISGRSRIDVKEVEEETVTFDTLRPDEGAERLEARPASPQLQEVMRQTARTRKVRKASTASDTEGDSDSDIRTSLQQVAVKSRILSPSSRLLNTRPPMRRASSTISTLRLSESGWSGSESEEEHYVSEIRNIALRKLSQKYTPAPRSKRPSLDNTSSSRFSNLSQASQMSMSTADTSTILTPSSSMTTSYPLMRLSSTGSVPGDFPWGRSGPSSPTGSSFGINAKDFYGSLKCKSVLPMPKPLRDVRGWGPPEILIDEDWPSTSDEGSSRSMAGTDTAEATPTMASAARVPSPEFVVSRTDEDWLMDEELPALTPGLVKVLMGATVQPSPEPFEFHAM